MAGVKRVKALNGTCAPVEDLALSVEDFESLCADGVLKPHAHHLNLKPHIRLWGSRSAPGRTRASGHIEIEGFLPSSVLRLAGYRVKSDQSLSEEEEKKQILDQFEVTLVQFLRQHFPQCQVTVSPATVFCSS